MLSLPPSFSLSPPFLSLTLASLALSLSLPPGLPLLRLLPLFGPLSLSLTLRLCVCVRAAGSAGHVPAQGSPPG
eukprot:623053-Rhodomonas_salina.1